MFIIFILQLVISAESTKILGVFPAFSYSHYILGHTLMNELSTRGHDVTVIGTYDIKSSKYSLIKIKMLFEEHENKTRLFNFENVNPTLEELQKLPVNLQIVESTLQQKVVQEFLYANRSFDLVVLEDFRVYSLLGLCHHYRAACITLTSTGLSKFISSQVANPISPSHYPDLYQPYNTNMDLFQRLSNSISYILNYISKQTNVLPRHNEILHKYFPGAPYINQLFYNISLILINQHVTTQSAVPLVPNLVDIGGIHIKPTKKLPRHLKEYLDNAEKGAIYFSMGSLLKCSDIPIEKRKKILRVFGKLEQKVLWKCDAEDMHQTPSNAMVKGWLPQQDILAHPNLKLFITHGGLLSIIEAVHFSVPILGIPVHADQKMNMANAVSKGIGLTFRYSSLTEDILFDTITELLTKPKYKEAIERFSRIMHDQPLNPLDKAVFWTEYVIRHKGGLHLRSSAVHLPWYQYFLIDVAAFIVFIPFMVGIIIKILINKLSKL